MRLFYGDGVSIAAQHAEKVLGFPCVEKPINIDVTTPPTENVSVVVEGKCVGVGDAGGKKDVTAGTQTMLGWHFLGLDTPETLRHMQKIHGAKCMCVKEENNSGMHYRHWEATRYDGTLEGLETTNYGDRQEITRYWDTARKYDALRITAKYQGNRSIIIHHRVQDVNLKLIYSVATGRMAYVVGYVETTKIDEIVNNKTRCNFNITFGSEIDITFFDSHSYKYVDYAACCGPTGDRSIYRRMWQSKHAELPIQYPQGCSRKNWNPSVADVVNALHGHAAFRYARASIFTRLLMLVCPHLQAHLDESTWLRIFQCDELECTLFPQQDDVPCSGYDVTWRQGDYESIYVSFDRVSLLKRPTLNDVLVIREMMYGDDESRKLYWSFPDELTAAGFTSAALKFSFSFEQPGLQAAQIKKPFASFHASSRYSLFETYTHTSLSIDGIGEISGFHRQGLTKHHRFCGKDFHLVSHTIQSSPLDEEDLVIPPLAGPILCMMSNMDLFTSKHVAEVLHHTPHSPRFMTTRTYGSIDFYTSIMNQKYPITAMSLLYRVGSTARPVLLVTRSGGSMIPSRYRKNRDLAFVKRANKMSTETCVYFPTSSTQTPATTGTQQWMGLCVTSNQGKQLSKTHLSLASPGNMVSEIVNPFTPQQQEVVQTILAYDFCNEIRFPLLFAHKGRNNDSVTFHIGWYLHLMENAAPTLSTVHCAPLDSTKHVGFTLLRKQYDEHQILKQLSTLTNVLQCHPPGDMSNSDASRFHDILPILRTVSMEMKLPGRFFPLCESEELTTPEILDIFSEFVCELPQRIQRHLRKVVEFEPLLRAVTSRTTHSLQDFTVDMVPATHVHHHAAADISTYVVIAPMTLHDVDIATVMMAINVQAQVNQEVQEYKQGQMFVQQHRVKPVKIREVEENMSVREFEQKYVHGRQYKEGYGEDEKKYRNEEKEEKKVKVGGKAVVDGMAEYIYDAVKQNNLQHDREGQHANEEKEEKEDDFLDVDNVYDDAEYQPDRYELLSKDTLTMFQVTEEVQNHVWKQHYRVMRSKESPDMPPMLQFGGNSSKEGSKETFASNGGASGTQARMNHIDIPSGFYLLRACLGNNEKLQVKLGDRLGRWVSEPALYKAATYRDEQGKFRPCLVKLLIQESASVEADDNLDKIAPDDVVVEWIRRVQVNCKPNFESIHFTDDLQEIICQLCNDKFANTQGTVSPGHPTTCLHRFCSICVGRIMKDATLRKCALCRAPWSGMKSVPLLKTPEELGALNEAYSIYFNRGFTYRVGAHLCEPPPSMLTTPASRGGRKTCQFGRYPGCLRYNDAELMTYFGLLEDPLYASTKGPVYVPVTYGAPVAVTTASSSSASVSSDAAATASSVAGASSSFAILSSSPAAASSSSASSGCFTLPTTASTAKHSCGHVHSMSMACPQTVAPMHDYKESVHAMGVSKLNFHAHMGSSSSSVAAASPSSSTLFSSAAETNMPATVKPRGTLSLADSLDVFIVQHTDRYKKQHSVNERLEHAEENVELVNVDNNEADIRANESEKLITAVRSDAYDSAVHGEDTLGSFIRSRAIVTPIQISVTLRTDEDIEHDEHAPLLQKKNN